MVGLLQTPRLRGFSLASLDLPTSLALAVGAVAASLGVITGLWPYLIFLAVLIPLGLTVVKRPQTGILIFAALIPFDGLHYVVPIPVWAEGWKEAFVLGLLIATFLCPADARGARGRRVPGWVPAVAVLFAIAVITVPMVGMGTALVGLRISYFNILIAVAVWRCPLDRDDRDRLINIFIGVAIITSIYGIYQQVVGHAQLAAWGYPYNEVIRFASGWRLRSFSTFNQPFPFAFYLMLTVLIALPRAIADPKRLRNRIFLFSLPLIGVAIVFAYVRGAWLGLGIGLLYLAFHRYKILVAFIPLAFAALLFMPGGSSFTSAALQSNSLNVRTTSWADRGGAVWSNPIGDGIGTTGAAAAKVALTAAPTALGVNTFQADNAYLKVGLEIGVAGLWLFVSLLVSAFLTGRYVEKRVEEEDKHFAAGWSAQVLGIMGACFVASYFEMIPMDALFWLMLAVVSTMAPRMRGVSESELTPVGVPESRSRAEITTEESAGPVRDWQRVTP